MNKILVFALSILTLTGLLQAHENWVMVDNYYPDSGDTLTITLSGGHHFPENDVLISENLLYQPKVILPDNSTESLHFQADENRWTAQYIVKQPGVHLIRIDLKRPQMDRPLFYGEAIIIAGKSDNYSAYRQNLPLGILPGKALSSYTAGSTLSLKLLRDGKLASGTLSLIPAGGRENFLTVSPDAPAEFKMKSSGAYLATVSESGVTCSVTFAIKP